MSATASSSTGTSTTSSSSSSTSDMFGAYGPFGPTFAIIPGVQSYDWGLSAEDGSLVAQMAAATPEAGVQIEGSRKYAELWMGTHPTLPSLIIPPPHSPKPPTSEGTHASYISLASYLSRHPQLQGSPRLARYFDRPKGELPFLFKILSVGKALSIQAHPDKTLAKRLHKEKPSSYKDDNHKPEMAVALTAFRGFCGFRPLSEIAHHLDAVPEFARVVNAPSAFAAELAYVSKPSAGTTEEEAKSWIRGVFDRLMNAKPTLYKQATMELAARYSSALEAKEVLEVDESLARLVCKLNAQYPGDVGVLCAFVLNVTDLQPGQALFLGANEPHAYIEGDIVECMAASDNVVRAGLTPKERDVKTLVEMLTYSSGSAKRQLWKPVAFDSEAEKKAEEEEKASSLLYDPPIEEFSVVRTTLSAGAVETHRRIEGPSILIVTKGSGTLTSTPRPLDAASSGAAAKKLQEGLLQPDAERTFKLEKMGQCFFVGAGSQVTLKAAEDGEKEEALIVFRAFVELPHSER